MLPKEEEQRTNKEGGIFIPPRGILNWIIGVSSLVTASRHNSKHPFDWLIDWLIAADLYFSFLLHAGCTLAMRVITSSPHHGSLKELKSLMFFFLTASVRLKSYAISRILQIVSFRRSSRRQK
jgi:hypothetical protein